MDKDYKYQNKKLFRDDHLDTYLEELLVKHDPTVCEQLNHTHTMPEKKMLISPVQGQFLQWLIKANRVTRILEIGTYTGYSALIMAQALPKNGTIITLDRNKEWNQIAQRFWSKSPVGEKIKPILGDAKNTLKDFEGSTFDFIFIDADKKSYPDYVEACLELLTKNGTLVIDNVLWRGDVAQPKESHMGDFLRDFNFDMSQRVDLTITIVPIGDGMMLVKKMVAEEGLEPPTRGL